MYYEPSVSLVILIDGLQIDGLQGSMHNPTGATTIATWSADGYGETVAKIAARRAWTSAIRYISSYQDVHRILSVQSGALV